MDTLNQHRPPFRPNRFADDRRIVERCKDLPWQCGACGALLAFVDRQTKSIVRIKRSDLFVTIGQPGWIKIMCRECGVENSMSSDEPAPEPVADSST